MTELADAVLPLIRTRADLHRWSASNAHGRQMHDAVDLLEQAAATENPASLYAVTHRALASAVKIIARADDSSGIIGDACRRLLALHPVHAAGAGVAPGRLVDWMIRFQFDGDVDYFEIDPVAYAPALGEHGVAAYRDRLAEIRGRLGAEPAEGEWWRSESTHEWFTLHHNEQRLAVLDRDVEEIVRTHARDRKVAAWLHDTAEALEEIGEIDLAVDWARRATEHDRGHQSLRAARYWCSLLAAHRPDELSAARLQVFRTWPSATTAGHLLEDAGAAWPDYRDEVLDRLAADPREAVLFALLGLKDARLAWDLAHELELRDVDAWDRLVDAYERIDPRAVLPVQMKLVEAALVKADAHQYRLAARRLRRMRTLARETEDAAAVDAFVASLRVEHRRRPRLQQELDRAGLP
ncbi:DUF6880 family protein [Georgenia sp. M64]|uniref:DUF6880 family protein n=1 Tax=Georgenia sp. M64 TaxID=3120520 RepID=UPI0030DF369E